MQDLVAQQKPIKEPANAPNRDSLAKPHKGQGDSADSVKDASIPKAANEEGKAVKGEEKAVKDAGKPAGQEAKVAEGAAANAAGDAAQKEKVVKAAA
ncbi:hypothetical protein CEP52_004920 [Fusarium oligoseptatum]|uniref:Uncharacterized protein n=3 Tax=Fusarium solani species complex TaxID=232080 RepID=A0A428U157_9HYPO|nr:hypothetical protein CEP52_004920 [Fusarium oligoseptatum]